jgi:hypothetical protein
VSDDHSRETQQERLRRVKAEEEALRQRRDVLNRLLAVLRRDPQTRA